MTTDLSSPQYYYSVRVLPGQEPFNVWVGWVTSNFHQHDVTFDPESVHTVTVTLGDESGKVQERLVYTKTVDENTNNSQIWCLKDPYGIFRQSFEILWSCATVTKLQLHALLSPVPLTGIKSRLIKHFFSLLVWSAVTVTWFVLERRPASLRVGEVLVLKSAV